MSVSIQEITTTTRNLIGDFEKNLVPGDIFTYGSSSIFTLSESNVGHIIDVLVNDVASGITHSYNGATNKVTISSSMTSGDTVEIQYSYFPNYSNSEIEGYIAAALVHLSINNYYSFEIIDDIIYPEPSDKECNLIALIASILIEPDNKSYTLPDVRISVPKDLPTNEKISKIIALAKKDGHGSFGVL